MDGVNFIDDYLNLVPDAKYWALQYGTNDDSGVDTALFRSNLVIMLDKIIAAGHTPIFARTPSHAGGPSASLVPYVAVVDDLTDQYHLHHGPDLYTFFGDHGDLLPDGTHPDSIGAVEINRLWAEAVDTLFKDVPTSISGSHRSIVDHINYIRHSISVPVDGIIHTGAEPGQLVNLFDLAGNRIATLPAGANGIVHLTGVNLARGALVYKR